jgi:uncharacterized protein
MIKNPMTHILLPSWRETVRAAAQSAARVEDRGRWGDICTPFEYRWEHVQAVVRLAKRTGADREVCEAAAWLHDVAKAQSTEPTGVGAGRRKDHGRGGALAARRILARTNFPTHKVEAVADAIAKHVGLSHDEPIEPLEAAVLWDADKLSKLGATIVLHGAGYLLAEGTNTTEELIERLWDEGWEPTADRTGIVDNLNTVPARMAGRERLETYRTFCQQAIREYAGDDIPE